MGWRYNEEILASSATQSKSSFDSRSHPGGARQSGASAGTALFGRGADFFLLGPGLTLLVSGLFAALAALGRSEAAASLALALGLLFVGPHYAATYRRAYTSRDILSAHPVVTLGAPVVLAGLASAAVAWPATVGVAFFAAYVIWSGYHYSGQSLGLAMLYPLRQGVRLTPDEKRLVALPLYASWLLSLLGLFRLEVAARNPAYLLTRQALFRAPLPGWALGVAAALVLASLSSLAVLARRRSRQGTPLPGAVWAVVLTQVTWFSFGLWNPFFNIVLVPVFHGAQYLAITSWHQTRGRSGGVFAFYVVTVLALGLLVNPGLVALGQKLGGEGAVAAAAALSFINLHHFLMDGRIWRLRDRRVAAGFVNPPLTSRQTETGAAGAADAPAAPDATKTEAPR